MIFQEKEERRLSLRKNNIVQVGGIQKNVKYERNPK